jgi:hypothetical protein
MPNRPDTGIEVMLQRWRDSRGRTDAIDLWKAATGVRVGEYAFTAVATDQSVLNRLPQELAVKLVRDAEEYVATARIMFGKRSPDESPAAAAIFAVTRAVANWRNRKAASSAGADYGLAGTIPSTPSAADVANAEEWKEALKKYPQFDETTGAMTLATVVALGGQGLAKVREPWDGLLSLGAARYAARAERGDLLRPAPSQADIQAAIAAVQEYASITGRSPWDVGYTGRIGSPATQALRLARDAGICSDIAASLPDGPAMPGFAIWSAAEERHAFASMALDRSLVMGMPVEEAQRFASAVLRHAAAIKAAPDGSTASEGPGFHGASLEAVALAARAVMPNGPQPRRWEATVESLEQRGVKYMVWKPMAK